MPSTTLTGSDQLIVTAGVRGVRYLGFTICNTSSTDTARIRIFDGSSTTAVGPILDEVTLAANESARERYSAGDAEVATAGIVVQVVSGSVTGSVRYS